MSSVLLDFPIPIFTQRLQIRPMQPGDGKQVFNEIEKSRDILHQWLPWVGSVKCQADSEVTARSFYADYILRKAFHLVVCLDDNIIGGVDLLT